MATDTPSTSTGRVEHCDSCERETRHTVAVEIRTENGVSDNAAYSREPYRIATCAICDTERVQRMNNA